MPAIHDWQTGLRAMLTEDKGPGGHIRKRQNGFKFKAEFECTVLVLTCTLGANYHQKQ